MVRSSSCHPGPSMPELSEFRSLSVLCRAVILEVLHLFEWSTSQSDIIIQSERHNIISNNNCPNASKVHITCCRVIKTEC